MQISLQKNAINQHGALCLATLLTKCPKLAFCDLTCNRLGPVGSASLAAAAACHPASCNLDLSCNEIGPEGATLLASALRYAHQKSPAKKERRGTQKRPTLTDVRLREAATVATVEPTQSLGAQAAESSEHSSPDAPTAPSFPTTSPPAPAPRCKSRDPGQHLHLFNNELKAEGIAVLTPVLPLLLKLSSLDLGHQFMYTAGAQHLAQVWKGSLSFSLSLS